MSSEDTELFQKLLEDRTTDEKFEEDKVLDKEWKIFVEPARVKIHWAFIFEL